MSLSLPFRRLGGLLRELVYPENAICLGCGAIPREGCLCDRCRTSLRNEGSSFGWIWRSLDGVPAYSLRIHEGLPRRFVIRLKHQAEACLAAELAALVNPLPVFLSFPPETVVTWVPMPRSRRRERCIDHGQRLAEAFAGELGLPCRQLLCRADDRSRTQASLSRKQRMANLRSSFSAPEAIDVPVLLVDDVLTTGTTALRCISALRRSGAREITVLTVTCASPN